MKIFVKLMFPLATVLIAAAMFLFVAREPTPALRYAPNMAEAGANVATALLVVTIFIERSIAVINSLFFGDPQRQAERKLLSADSATSAQGVTELVTVLTAKERLRLLLSFAAGLFVSAAGFRCLGGLLDRSGGTAQTPLFFTVDVLATAGLIAGGSNSLNFLLQYLKDLLTKGAGQPKPQIRSLLATTT